MPSKEQLKKNIDIDIASMEVVLRAKAAKTSINIQEFINLALLNGSSREAIRKELLRDLADGGRIFGDFRNSIKATSNGVINRLRDSGQFGELGEEGKYRWVAVLVNTCPDCLERHGEVKTFLEWEEFGLPRTGHTVCKENCKCMLLPADVAALEPIQRARK